MSYGTTNAVFSILFAAIIIFLTGIPLAYYAARYNIDLDLITRGAGFGYIGSVLTSIIFASFTFIFFALEGSIMAQGLLLGIGIPLWAGYLISTILVIHGPNLNLLGKREPEVYGYLTLDDINQQLTAQAQNASLTINTFQSNWEGAIVDRIHQAQNDGVKFIIINPAALTHTSVAVRDALLGVAIPFIEVHLSNVHAREAFRHHSYLSDKAIGVICGLGAKGYSFALDYAIEKIQSSN